MPPGQIAVYLVGGIVLVALVIDKLSTVRKAVFGSTDAAMAALRAQVDQLSKELGEAKVEIARLVPEVAGVKAQNVEQGRLIATKADAGRVDGASEHWQREFKESNAEWLKRWLEVRDLARKVGD